MTILEVIGSMPVEENTSVIVKGDGELLKNGIGILDSDGKPHRIISVGMSSPENAKDRTTPILVEGKFDSDRIYV